MRDNSASRSRQSLFTALALFLVALLSVTAATTAWLSLGDHTRVHSIVMDVTVGPCLRFDLAPHPEITDYTRTLNFDEIAARILLEKGFDAAQTPMEPVTTEDYTVFTFKDGEIVKAESGAYLEFTLHFISTRSCFVHLTSQNSSSGPDGTAVRSSVPTLPEALRISFTDGASTWVYDPGMGSRSEVTNGVRTFGLPAGPLMVYSQDNTMFSLTENVDKPIVVRIWLEGEDEACTDELQLADYEITLRFEATDENNNVIREDSRASR